MPPFLIFASGLGTKTSGLIMMRRSMTLSCPAKEPSLVLALSRASNFMITFSSLLLLFLKFLAALLLLVWSMECCLFEPIGSQSKAGTKGSLTCFSVALPEGQILKLRLLDLLTEPIQCLTYIASFSFLSHW